MHVYVYVCVHVHVRVCVAFNRARGHNIERENYLEHLRKGYINYVYVSCTVYFITMTAMLVFIVLHMYI